MRQWTAKVKFRDLFCEYDSNASDELKEIKRILPLWVDRFNLYPCLTHFITSLKKVKTESGFNKWLNRVYDYCDDNNIWVDF